MKAVFVCFFLATLLGFAEICHAGILENNYYDKEGCNGIEDDIRILTWKLVAADLTIPAKLIRMQFHDCFVRGCDASVLLDSTANNAAEKSGRPNLSLGGFDVIDEIKAMVEERCPEKVSCADIIALSTRDAISFLQFGSPLWNVVTGRRDGTVSVATEANQNLPSPFAGFATLLQSFNNKGLTLRDLVVLSGAHTIGIAHCNTFSKRLYNFTGNNDMDPSLDANYAAILKTRCTSLSDNVTFVGMDPSSALSFDNHYYRNLKLNRGLFVSDAALLTNNESADIVDSLLNWNEFFTEFGKSMENLIEIGVLTGNQGQIRKNCSVVNS